MLRYRIFPKSPEAHLFEVSVTTAEPEASGQRFALPAWTPGSYLIREFARHFITVKASSRGRPVRIAKEDKHTWRAAPCAGPLTVTAEVYAWDLSVRGAHLDTTHGFFNGPCVFLRVLGQEDRPCELEIVPPRGARYRTWRVATAMRAREAERHAFGIYAAQDYDELIDHPVEMGTFTLAAFGAGGVPHEVAISGRHDADTARLCRDLRKLCAAQQRLFGGAPPMDRYVFLVTAIGEGYGGLEHRASTALLCSREQLPRRGVRASDEGYRGFLGLCSHEYFHAWNVQRIKPAAFVPYRLDRENYTRLLWAFEGFTSYYDDLMLKRCGLLSEDVYLAMLAQNLTNALRGSARFKQSVAESSFDAWIKFYRRDENAPNAVVSYYSYGAAVALTLDLTMRTLTGGGRSLDDLMRALWQRHGSTGLGVPEDGIERIATELVGKSLRRFFARHVYGTQPLPLAARLAAVGVKLKMRPAAPEAGRAASAAPAPRVTLGIRSAPEGNDVKVDQVYDAGPAQAAGISAGDVIVAVDGLRVTARNLEARLARSAPGERIRLLAFRRDELHEFDVVLRAPPADTCVLEIDDSSKSAMRARAAWLGARKRRRRS